MVERGALLDTVRSAAGPLGPIGLALEPSQLSISLTSPLLLLEG